ncbi:MAG: hypothetical protein ACOYMF_05275 [Bacteroidales bacterium]
MHTIEIPEIKYKAEIASEISELSPREYLKFVELLLMLEDGKLTWEQLRIHLIIALLDIRKSRRRITEDEALLIQANLYQLSELMDSFCNQVDNDGNSKLLLNISFTKNLIPRIGNLYGPDDALTNITFQEYIDAHNCYIRCIDNVMPPDELNHLCAILYRPRKYFLPVRRYMHNWNGQERIPYNDNNINRRRNYFARVPFHVKYAVFLWFRGCEEFLRDGEISIGESTIKLSLLYEKHGSASGDNTGLVGVLYTLAESGVFGNAKQTAETNLFDVLIRIYQLLKLLKDTDKKVTE